MNISRTLRAILLLVAFFLASNQVHAVEIEIVHRVELPIGYHYARDVRWLDDNRVVVAAGYKHGLVSVQLPTGKIETFSPGGRRDLWASHVAAAKGRVFFAAPFFMMGWIERVSGKRVTIPFDGPNDIDAHGDEVVVSGAQRDEKGRYAPEGALVWRGMLGNGSVKWKPIFFSEAGAGAKPFAFCGMLGLDAIRYLADGSLIIAPGVQPGVFRYSSAGKLMAAWQSSAIGFYDRCEITEAEWTSIRTDQQYRMRWINRNVVLDEILPLEHPTLLVRRSDGKTTQWEWVELLPGGKVRKSAFPLRASSPNRRIQADVRDGKIVFLLSSGTVEEPEEAPQLIVARVK